MLIKKNSDGTIKTSLVVYFLFFFLGFPVINKLNPLFYVFLSLVWIFFGITCYFIYTNQSINYSNSILIGGFVSGLILNITSNFTLSDDIYRYFFDGFLIQHQIRPMYYQYFV